MCMDVFYFQVRSSGLLSSKLSPFGPNGAHLQLQIENHSFLYVVILHILIVTPLPYKENRN